MAGRYITVAIDHGTTNSAIATLDDGGPRVIKPDGVDDVMPSAVFITNRRRELVGKPAYVRILTASDNEGNGVTGYKPDIGQDHRYDFKAAQVVKTGPELGGMVMGALLNAYRAEYDEPVKSCVITVPAKFEQSACDATREAAKLAGLSFAPLLQEPVAAAMAYGFSTDDTRAKWMIFDLGGGTLDVSLVFVQDGRLVAPRDCNAGDNRLGGRLFDNELMKVVLGELRERYSLADFGEQTHKTAWGRLLLAIERAKIELSRGEDATVELDSPLCEDEAGKPVEVAVKVKREVYEHILGPHLEKAVHICHTLLRKHRLQPSDIDRLILVGGPTKTPYVQHFLKERLVMPIEASIDPMTVVAQGAAIYASTIEDEHAEDGSDTAGALRLELQYETKSNVPTYWMVGKVLGAENGHAGMTVEVRRLDGGWESGPIAVDDNHLFQVELRLVAKDKPYRSRFACQLKDETGQVLCAVDEPEIWFPFPDVDLQTSNSIRVGVKGNRAVVLIESGATLPEEKTRDDFVTTEPLKKGSSGDVVNIPILEGVTHLLGEEDGHEECNVRLGMLTIHGDDTRVDRDLPKGAKVEVTLHMDKSRIITARAYVPLLDEEFEATMERGTFGVTLEEIQRRFEEQKQHLASAKALQEEQPLPKVAEALGVIERLEVERTIGEEIERAEQGADGAAENAYRKLLELTGTLYAIADMQRRPRIERHIESLRPMVEGHSASDLNAIEQEYAEASDEDLYRIEESLNDLDWSVRGAAWNDLRIDVHALSGMRVTNLQAEKFKECDAFIGNINDRGGLEAVTPEDVTEMRRLHLSLSKHYDNLFEKREEFLNQLRRDGHTVDDLGQGLEVITS